MPASSIPAFAKKSDKSESKVEKLWHKAKGIAKEQGLKIGKSKESKAKFYSYVTGILKKMLSITESEVQEQFGHLMTEMLTSADLSAAIDWDETPSDVKDSHTGEKSKLPIHHSKKMKNKNKKKKKVRDYLRTK